MNYYAGKHDIEQYRIFFIDANGKLKEDFTKSNIRISHPFFRIIAEQEAQYILSGKEPIFNSDLPELQTWLDEYFNNNDDFNSERGQAFRKQYFEDRFLSKSGLISQ